MEEESAMIAFLLGIILGILGGFLLLALVSELSKFFLAKKGNKYKIYTESSIFAIADGYHDALALPGESATHQ